MECIIKIQGHLDEQWADWFSGLSVTLESDGITIISGSVVDQAALHGLLKKLRNLGLPLLSVICDPGDQTATRKLNR